MDHLNNRVNIPKTFNILGITFQEIDPMTSFFASVPSLDPALKRPCLP